MENWIKWLLEIAETADGENHDSEGGALRKLALNMGLMKRYYDAHPISDNWGIAAIVIIALALYVSIVD